MAPRASPPPAVAHRPAGSNSCRSILSAAAGMAFKYFMVYVVRDGYIYILSGSAMAEDFDAVLPDFEAFAGTLRFE